MKLISLVRVFMSSQHTPLLFDLILYRGYFTHHKTDKLACSRLFALFNMFYIANARTHVSIM
jgi:hypothetical protein